MIFKYLVEILKLGVIFRSNSINESIRYINLNWAQFKDQQNFINKYIFLFLSRLISYQLK